jgi:ATP synthase I subunit
MDLDRAVGRIFRLTLAVIALGATVYFLLDSWRGGLGFLLGGMASYVNFRWLKRTVYALGEAAGGKPPRARVAVLLGLRYLLLGGAAYAILRFSEISLTAAMVGLFAPAAAVILEILIELIYAGT